jgi:hypothetical protein
MYHSTKGKGKSFLGEKGSPTGIYAFAEEAVELLKRNNPASIVDGLVRVDIMCTKYGRLIINEFENLEAGYQASSSSFNYEAFVFNFLVDCWFILQTLSVKILYLLNK